MATWKYVGNVLLPASLDSSIIDEWEETLSAESGRIHTALTTKIADGDDYNDKIGTPSHEAYDAFLQDVGEKWDMALIKLKQKVKVLGKYDKWKTSVDAIFGGVTPTFPTLVTAKKGKLSELRRVIGVVGHRSLGTWEPATMAVLLARGDTRCAIYFDDNDTFTGTLEAVFDAQKGALISPSLIAEMVYACVMARYMYDAGLSAQIAAFLAAENAVIAALVGVALNLAHVADFTIVLSWNGTNFNVDITAEDTV